MAVNQNLELPVRPIATLNVLFAVLLIPTLIPWDKEALIGIVWTLLLIYNTIVNIQVEDLQVLECGVRFLQLLGKIYSAFDHMVATEGLYK
eukprot:gene24073-29216_t